MRINVIQTVAVNVGKSNIADPIKKPNTKKKVNWADANAKQLEYIQTFHLDETEKGFFLFRVILVFNYKMSVFK
jgi:hypothetical protein